LYRSQNYRDVAPQNRVLFQTEEEARKVASEKRRIVPEDLALSLIVRPLGYEYLGQSSIHGLMTPDKTLIKLSDEELKQRFIESAEAALLSHTTYYEEIKRRSEAKHTKAMVRLTWVLVILTVFASLAAVGSTIISFYALKKP
jgi:hypothetical protein